MCFVFKQKTAYAMRIIDGSSDVCSSDLAAVPIVSGCTAQKRSGLDDLIIGGGLSGLAAGWELKKGGFERFAVLEARDRVGGRTLNQTVNGAPVEAGATWIGGGQTAMSDLCRELGIGVYPAY